MSVFRTAAPLVSWAKFCPQVKQSAGKTKGSNSRGKGNRYLAGLLGEATVRAGRAQTRIGARYRRLSTRPRDGQAPGPSAHRQPPPPHRPPLVLCPDG